MTLPAIIDEVAVQAALDEPTMWPNLSQTASITGLNKSTLSKQATVGNIASTVRGFGQGERVLPPDEVLRIGNCYHRVPQSTVIDRLAAFLSKRLSTDTSVVRRVLLTIVDASERSDSQPQNAGHIPNNLNPKIETPSWLLNVERLRENPAALRGTLSFASADVLNGTIELGPSIDEPIAVDGSALTTKW